PVAVPALPTLPRSQLLDRSRRSRPLLPLLQLAPFGRGLPAELVLGLAPFRLGLGVFERVESAADGPAVDSVRDREVANAGAAADAAANELHLPVGQLRLRGHCGPPLLARCFSWDII